MSIQDVERLLVDELRRLADEGHDKMHGFGLAKSLVDRGLQKHLLPFGTLYRALDRLEKSGRVMSYWESADDAAAEGRPPRRYYRLCAPR